MRHSLLIALESPDTAERVSACSDAAEDASAVLFVDALTAALTDPERAVRRAACDALVKLGKAPGAYPDVERALHAALRRDQPDARWGAAFALSRLGPPEARLLPAVVECLDARDGDVRWAAARLLVELARLHPEAEQVALALLRSAESPRVRRMAAYCSREIAPDDPATALALVGAAGAADLELRRAAYTALIATLDPPPAVATHLVWALTEEPDPAARRIAVVAITTLGGLDGGALWRSCKQSLEAAAEQRRDPALARAAERAIARLGALHES